MHACTGWTTCNGPPCWSQWWPPGWWRRRIGEDARSASAFLASNLLWIAWGLYAQAYALILLQVCLAAMNLRGTHRNEAPQDSA